MAARWHCRPTLVALVAGGLQGSRTGTWKELGAYGEHERSRADWLFAAPVERQTASRLSACARRCKGCRHRPATEKDRRGSSQGEFAVSGERPPHCPVDIYYKFSLDILKTQLDADPSDKFLQRVAGGQYLRGWFTRPGPSALFQSQRRIECIEEFSRRFNPPSERSVRLESGERPDRHQSLLDSQVVSNVSSMGGTT